MEVLGLIDLPRWLLAIIFFVGSVIVYTWHKRRYFSRLGITTMPSTFLLGDLPLINKKGFGYYNVDMVEKYGKVFGAFMGNTPSLVISDTDIIKEIMVKEFSKFTDRSNILPTKERWDSSLSLASGAHWKYLRTTISPSFSSGKIKAMTPYIHKCLDTLHEVVEEKIETNPEGFNLEPILNGYALDVLCCTGFGIEVDSQRNPDSPFIKHSKELLDFSPGSSFTFILRCIFPDLAPLMSRFFPSDLMSDTSWNFFDDMTKSIFAERKGLSTKHNDLLQLMINSRIQEGKEQDDGERDKLSVNEFKQRGLTDLEVLINSITFMSAGFDTTATTLAWAAYELALNPDVQDKLTAEIDADLGGEIPSYDNVFKLQYLDMVVHETLRRHSPSNRFNREASEDMEICGVKIKKGMDCTISQSTLHFMPEYWPNPMKFDPERFAPENKANINEYAFMPFGVGPRNCIGKRLALLEVKMSLVSLLQKYRLLKTDKLAVPMPETISILRKPANPLILKVVKRT